MAGRLVHKADFERLLATRPVRRSAHFAIHHAPTGAATAGSGVDGTERSELSTASERVVPRLVDDRSRRIGWIVPKRHARRAVTRSLLKRQIRATFTAHEEALAGGDWLVRLAAAFAVADFPAAASTALKRAARTELGGLFDVLAARR